MRGKEEQESACVVTENDRKKDGANDVNEVSEHERRRMKDIPDSERPYERCMKYGAKSLTDAELIAVIIRTGSSKENSTELAERILNLVPGRQGLKGLLGLTERQLKELPGVGPVKTVQILCLAELSMRIWKARAAEKLDFTEPGTIADYYMEEMRHRPTECVMVVFLDSKKRFLGDAVVSTGGLDETFMHPREVFRLALKYNAASIVLLHNHPSGDTSPSISDIVATKRTYQAGKLLGISLNDHLIIGDGTFFSLYDSKHWSEISRL